MKSILPLLLFLGIVIHATQAQNFSLKFDGDDDFGIFPKCEAMTEPSFTIEGWFKCGYVELPQVVMMSFLEIPDKNANVTLEVRENGRFRFNYRPIAVVLGGEDMYSNSVVNDNAWHHFAAVKGGSAHKGVQGWLRLYIDGMLEVERTGVFEDIDPAPIFELGKNRYEDQANYRLFRGNMDDIKIWKRAKNSLEIFNDFKSESSGLELKLFSNYKFDITTDSLYDCSPNLRHGIRGGAFGGNNLPQFSPDIPQLVDKECETQLVGIQDEFQYPGMALAVISPNPVPYFLKVELNEIQKVHAKIYASDGRLVHDATLSGQLNQIDVSTWPSGTYLIQLNSNKRVETQRFIKI